MGRGTTWRTGSSRVDGKSGPCLPPAADLPVLTLPEIHLTLRQGLDQNSHRQIRAREITGREPWHGQLSLPPVGGAGGAHRAAGEGESR